MLFSDESDLSRVKNHAAIQYEVIQIILIRKRMRKKSKSLRFALAEKTTREDRSDRSDGVSERILQRGVYPVLHTIGRCSRLSGVSAEYLSTAAVGECSSAILRSRHSHGYVAS